MLTSLSPVFVQLCGLTPQPPWRLCQDGPVRFCPAFEVGEEQIEKQQSPSEKCSFKLAHCGVNVWPNTKPATAKHLLMTGLPLKTKSYHPPDLNMNARHKKSGLIRSQKMFYAVPVLFRFWCNIYDVGPAPSLHCVYLLGLIRSIVVRARAAKTFPSEPEAR